jgi:hypothetical protein
LRGEPASAFAEDLLLFLAPVAKKPGTSGEIVTDSRQLRQEAARYVANYAA